VARQQVENGAQIIDINMDEGMLDSEQAMTTFLHHIAAEPDIARVPIMSTAPLENSGAGLKCIQGKGVVNSISSKRRRKRSGSAARLIRRYGGHSGHGHLTKKARRIRSLEKWKYARGSNGFLPKRLASPRGHYFRSEHSDIATGIEEHKQLRGRFYRGHAANQGYASYAKVSAG